MRHGRATRGSYGFASLGASALPDRVRPAALRESCTLVCPVQTTPPLPCTGTRPSPLEAGQDGPNRSKLARILGGLQFAPCGSDRLRLARVRALVAERVRLNGAILTIRAGGSSTRIAMHPRQWAGLTLSLPWPQPLASVGFTLAPGVIFLDSWGLPLQDRGRIVR